MNLRSTSSESPVRPAPTGFEEQLWPAVCATLALVGILSVVIYSHSDFEDERLLLNGYTHLAILGLLAGMIVLLCSRLKGPVRRTAELAILLSLVIHAGAGLGAVYLFNSPLPGAGLAGSGSNTAEELVDAETASGDFRWSDGDDLPEEQAFEKPMEIAVPEQAPPAAQIAPRDMERPAPVAEIRRPAEADLTPLGVGAATDPGSLPDIRRAELSKPEDPNPLEGLAMVRQKSEDLSVPKTEAPAPVAPAEGPKEPPKKVESRAMAVEKADKVDWSALAGKASAPNLAPVPRPRKMARTEADPGDSMPSLNVVAQSRAQPVSPMALAPAGPQAADAISQRGSTLERSDRDGAWAPSTVVPDAGLPPQLPAAAGGSAPSRLQMTSTVAVERSEGSRAPLGPTTAAGGTQDFGRGSSLLPTRRGAIDGRGRAQPSIEGNTAEDPSELRSGAPGSNFASHLPLSASPARRAIASQTDRGGSGLSPDQAATLPRTQAEMGLPLPSASLPSDNTRLAGAGGVALTPGGKTSMLDVGQKIAVRRMAGAGDTRGASRDVAWGDAGIGEPSAIGDASLRGRGAFGDPGASGPRRIDLGAPAGEEDGAGSVPRARTQGIDPRATIDPVGPVAGTAVVNKGPAVAAGARDPGVLGTSPAFAPVTTGVSPQDYGAREGAGQRIGMRPSAQADPSDFAPAVGAVSPQHSGLARSSRAGDGPSDVLASGGPRVGGVTREKTSLVVSGQVYEPLEPFRRGRAQGGPSVGAAFGGQLTEPAIENGLEFFSRSQFPDGHWSLHESPPGMKMDEKDHGTLEADTAATGLALLTYLGAGYTHQQEKHREVVRRGLNWLLTHQKEDGNLSVRGSEPTHFYSQGIAAMALCEAYGMTQDPDLRQPAQKAIDYIVRSQDPNRGGWRYRPREGSDTSVTGWQLIALKSAQLAGLEVPRATLDKVSHWLDLAQAPNRGTYVYNPWNADDYKERMGRAPSPTMTAQAMIMRMYLGQHRDNELLRQGADYLLAHLPDMATASEEDKDVYYWYYATQAMYHMQGEYWRTWDARVTPLLRAGQVASGPLKGSWDPNKPLPGRWSTHGGRQYVTAMHVLALEFRYWHLPLFQELR